MESGLKHPRITALVGSILVVATLYFAKAVLVLVAVAFLLAFLLAPVVTRVQRLRIGRVPAVAAVLLCVFVVALGIGWIVVGEVTNLIDKLPEYKGNLQQRFADVTRTIRRPLDRARRSVADIAPETAESQPADFRVREVKDPAPPWDALLEPVGAIAGFLASMGIVILLIAIMLIQKEDMRDRLIRLAGGREIFLTTRAIDEASAKVSRYLLASSLLNGGHGLCVGLGLFLIGVPNALLWGLLSGLLRFIPYVGPWVAAAFPIALSLAVSPDWTMPLLTIGLILALEVVSNNLIEPWIYGRQTGISPGAVILAAIFWTWIWGIPGLFLATPLTVCLAVMGKHVPPLRFLHVLLGDEPVLSTETKLYQRLLARDLDEAWGIVEKELESKPEIEVFDEVLIPALAFAERERHEGSLDRATFDAVAEAMAQLVDEADDLKRESEEAKRAKEGLPVDARRTIEAPSMPILCVAAEDEADRVVAIMAEKLLRAEGFSPGVLPALTLTGELPKLVKERGAPIVLVSNFPPSGVAQVRYIIKRLLTNSQQLHVIVGIWGTPEQTQRTRDRLPPRDNIHVVSTLAEAMGRAHELSQGLSFESRASPDSETGRKTGEEVHTPRTSV